MEDVYFSRTQRSLVAIYAFILFTIIIARISTTFVPVPLLPLCLLVCVVDFVADLTKNTDICRAVLVIFALCFAAAGDLAMMANDLQGGIALFLAMHILYTLAFFSLGKRTSMQWFEVLILILSVSAYIVSFIISVRILDKYADTPLSGGVYLYVYVLYTMAITASVKLGILGTIGGLCFVLSDCLIGVQAFIHPNWFPPKYVAEIIIIATYGFAQFYIIMSFIQRQNQQNLISSDPENKV